MLVCLLASFWLSLLRIASQFCWKYIFLPVIFPRLLRKDQGGFLLFLHVGGLFNWTVILSHILSQTYKTVLCFCFIKSFFWGGEVHRIFVLNWVIGTLTERPAPPQSSFTSLSHSRAHIQYPLVCSGCENMSTFWLARSVLLWPHWTY